MRLNAPNFARNALKTAENSEKLELTATRTLLSDAVPIT